MSSLSWKFALILAVVALAGFFSFPPQERISLGLDLKGGAHIRMQVKTDDAVEHEVGLAQRRIDTRMTDAGITYDAIVTPEPLTVAVRGADASRASEVRAILEEATGSWPFDDLGGGNWRVRMPPETAAYYRTAAVDSALSIIRNRLDLVGVSEPLVQKEGLQGDRILIQIPGVEDPQRIKDLIQDQSMLSWREVSFPPGVTNFEGWSPPGSCDAVAQLFGGAVPEDTLLVEQRFTQIDGSASTVCWPLKQIAVVQGADLRNAYRSSDRFGSPAISFELTQEAGRRFEAATKANMRRRMAIVLDNTVISAPTIQGVIRDTGIIEGGFTVTQAEDLSMKLRSGAIPTELSIIEERTVGPSLGRDSIRRGLTAGLTGFVGVLLFMVVYYRLAGINAVVALAMNIVLVFGALGALPFLFSGQSGLRATLTLPGIAGLILTVGMAVDSNVLIFERIREELKLGKTVRSAVDQGFGKAFLTILDCNVTTVVAAIFLGLYGTGPVRGFAVTLIIGLMASMFTAVFVSRQLFELVLSRRSESLSI